MNTRISGYAMAAVFMLFILAGCMSVPMKKLQTGRYGHAAIADSHRIYIVDGSASNRFLGEIAAINVNRGTSVVLTTNLVPRRYLSAVLIDRRIYIMGGQSDVGPDPTVEIFDLDSGRVSHAPPMPTPRIAAKAVALDNKIYVIGGNPMCGDYTGLVDVYDVDSQSWEQAPPMNIARECAVTVANGRIFAIGGFSGRKGKLRTLESYSPGSKKWTKHNDLPFALSAHSAVTANNRIFTFGDYDDLARVTMYDLASNKWMLVDTTYKPSRHNAAVVIGGEVFVIGGNVDSCESHLDLIQRFRIDELSAGTKEPPINWVMQAREGHPRAYTKWTAEEDAILRDEYQQGTRIEEIAERLQRQVGSIQTRIRKQGLNKK